MEFGQVHKCLPVRSPSARETDKYWQVRLLPLAVYRRSEVTAYMTTFHAGRGCQVVRAARTLVAAGLALALMTGCAGSGGSDSPVSDTVDALATGKAQHDESAVVQPAALPVTATDVPADPVAPPDSAKVLAAVAASTATIGGLADQAAVAAKKAKRAAGKATDAAAAAKATAVDAAKTAAKKARAAAKKATIAAAKADAAAAAARAAVQQATATSTPIDEHQVASTTTAVSTAIAAAEKAASAAADTAKKARTWVKRIDKRIASCAATARACVDLTYNISWLQQGGTIVYGPVKITSGQSGLRTRPGLWTVYWKDKHHVSGYYGTPMPNSIFFDRVGIAFHQGSLTELSHGCVHLGKKASERYWNFLHHGDRVFVFGYARY